LPAEDLDALTTKLSKIITDGKGKVVSTEYWGLRNLAYKVKKNSRGHYVLLNIDAEVSVVNEMNRVISFNEDVIRSLTFVVEQHQKETLLFASKTAKDYKAGKVAAKKEPSKIDLVLEKVQFEI